MAPDIYTPILCVSNLHEDTKEADLIKLLGKFGFITHCKVRTDTMGKCSGFATITFKESVAARNAIANDNKLELLGRRLRVMKVPFRVPVKNIIFVRNLPAGFGPHKLKPLFTPFGVVNKICMISSGKNGILDCASISFIEASSAKLAIKEMNGKMIGEGVVISVSAFRSWWYRQRSIRERLQWKEDLYANPDATVYVSLFDASLTEEKLRDLFSVVGPIDTVRIAVTSNGCRKNYGFVRFEREEDACNALKMGVGSGHLAISKVWSKPAIKELNCPPHCMSSELPIIYNPVNGILMTPIPCYQSAVYYEGPMWDSTPNTLATIGQQQIPLPQQTVATSSATSAMTTDTKMLELQYLTSSLPSLAAEDQVKVRSAIGNIIYPIVHSVDPTRAGEITGALMAAPEELLQSVVRSRELLRYIVKRCVEELDS